MLKTKQLGNKLPLHSTNSLKPKKYCGQSCGLPGKTGKLNMITSTVANKYAVMRSFGSSSVVDLSSFFFVEDLEMLKNLEVLIS